MVTCKMMVQNVFSREDVGQFMNTRFVNVKLDMEKERGGVAKYQVKVYPAFLILNEDGEVIHKMVGENESRGIFTACAKWYWRTFFVFL